MTESKFKRIVVASTVGAVLLLFILIFIMVYQLVSIKVYNSEYDAIMAKIEVLEELKKEGADTLEIRKTSFWIEEQARKLGYRFDGDKNLLK